MNITFYERGFLRELLAAGGTRKYQPTDTADRYFRALRDKGLVEYEGIEVSGYASVVLTAQGEAEARRAD